MEEDPLEVLDIIRKVSIHDTIGQVSTLPRGKVSHAQVATTDASTLQSTLPRSQISHAQVATTDAFTLQSTLPRSQISHAQVATCDAFTLQSTLPSSQITHAQVATTDTSTVQKNVSSELLDVNEIENKPEEFLLTKTNGKMSPSLLNCFTKEKGTLITEQITVKVIDVCTLRNYTKRNGKTGKMFIAAICDTTDACLAKVYDPKKVTIIQTNNVLILRDFMVKESEISIAYNTTVGRTGGLPEIPDNIIDKASSLLSGTKSKGLLRGISALQVYKCCTKGECTNRKLEKNECPTCGQSYTEASSGNGFFGELLVETDSEANSLKIYTQQVEDLCTLLGCTSKSTSLKSDIAKKLPVSINFRKNGDKIIKISI